MKRKSLTSTALFSLAAALSLGFATSAKAQTTTVYTTNFNSPLYTDGVLVNPSSSGDTTTVGQDLWTNTNGNTNLLTISNTATNGFITLGSLGGQDVRRLLGNGLVTDHISITTGSIYWDADVTVSSVGATGDYSIHFTDGGTANFYDRTYFKSSGAGFVMALGTSSGTTGLVFGTTILNFNQTYHILGRYDFVSGGTTNDTGALFVNPLTMDGSGDTAYVAATLEGTDATKIDAIALRQGTNGQTPALTVDNLRVFATNVPEPATIATLVGGLAVLGLRRRSRRA